MTRKASRMRAGLILILCFILLSALRAGPMTSEGVKARTENDTPSLKETPAAATTWPYLGGDWLIDDDFWLIDENLMITGMITVNGSGFLHVVNTTLRFAGSDNGSVGIHVQPGGRLEIVSGSNLTSVNLPNRYDIDVVESPSFLMANSTVEYAGYNDNFHFQTGVHVENSSARIENNLFRNNFIGLFTERSYGGHIENNTFEQPLHVGVYVIDSLDTILIGNNITTSGGTGIAISNSPNSTLVGNMASKSQGALYPAKYMGFGFILETSNNSDMYDNFAGENKAGGFWAKDSVNADLYNNVADRNDRIGFFVTGTNYTLINNTASNTNSGEGFQVNTPRNITLIGNLAEYNQEHGFHFWVTEFSAPLAGNITVRNNTARYNGGCGFVSLVPLEVFENNTDISNTCNVSPPIPGFSIPWLLFSVLPTLVAVFVLLHRSIRIRSRTPE